MARLGKLALSRERPARPYPGRLVLGRTLLGRPLSQSPVVCESIELGALGHARIQATSAASGEATLHTAPSTAVERFRAAPARVLTITAIVRNAADCRAFPTLLPARQLVAGLIVAVACCVGQAACAASQDASSAVQVAWIFDAATPANSAGWSAERGTMTLAQAHAQIAPDKSRRVVLLSPSQLPDRVRAAESFVLGVTGTGFQRVRVQARRDPRGGWITIADASGPSLREVVGGVKVKRVSGARTAPIERLRIELTFRTTNPRSLSRIAIEAP
jgi:hypothetical protein